MKAAAMRLRKREPKKAPRQATLAMLAMLQQCTNIADATEKFVALSRVLRSPSTTTAVEDAKKMLLCDVDKTGAVSIDVGVDSDDLDEGQWVRDIGRKSPFARHLCGAAANVDKKVAADNSQTANDLHSHECFNVVTQLTAFFPMCSCLMHGSGDSSSNAPYWNAAVESHFRDTENVNADTTPST